MAGDRTPVVAADGTHVYAASDLAVAEDGHARDVVVVTRFTPEGEVVWTRQLDDPTATVDVTALAVTADGGGIATGLTSPPSTPPHDTVVARWDADGNVLWTTTIARAGFLAFVSAIAIAGDASVAVAGATMGPEHPSADGRWTDHAFVAKLDAAGGIRWTRVFDTPADDGATGVAFDAASNLYVCGYTFGAFPGSVSAGGMDQFLAKLTPDGDFH